jgi:hypothetical protein
MIRKIAGHLFKPIVLGLFAVTAQATPWALHTIDASGTGADGVRVADFNGDGLPDVVTAWEEGGKVKAYFHPGYAAAVSPWPSALLGKINDPEDVVAMTFNGEVIFISSTERENQHIYVHYREAPAAPWSTAVVKSSRADEPFLVRICRTRVGGIVMRLLGMDRSCWKGRMPQRWMYVLPLACPGPPAFVAGSKEHNGTLTLFRHDGKSFGAWKATPLTRVGWTMSIVQLTSADDGAIRLVYSDRRGSDLDGNGKLDDSIDPTREPSAPRRGVFMLSHRDGAWSKRALWTTEDEVMFLSAADINGDGRDDIVAATKGGYVMALESQVEGNFIARKFPLPDGVNRDLKAVAIGDIDGDGVPELVLSVETAKPKDLRVFAVYLDYRNSAIKRIEDIGGAKGQKFDRLELVDVNGDGFKDVLTTEENIGLGVIWYENPRGTAARTKKAK